MTSEEMKVRLDALRQLIAEMFPIHRDDISIRFQADRPNLEVTLYNCKDYDDATDQLRACGIGVRHKQIVNDHLPSAWTNVQGRIGEHTIHAFADGLPLACRLETYKERVPKVHEITTGEYVEVERARVVCK